MAIDADLSAGLIDEKTARTRRQSLEDESSFFGAMDGASKFVRGDAIAALLITFINVVGGIIIGVAQQGMTFSDAGKTYTLLTVGDGLVSQVPALIVSTAAGLLVSKAGVRGAAGRALGARSQLPEGARHVGRRDAADRLPARHPDAALPDAGARRRLPRPPYRAPAEARRGRDDRGAPGADGAVAGRGTGEGGDRGRPPQARRPEARDGLRAPRPRQRAGGPGPAHRPDPGPAPAARRRARLRDALGAHPRQRPARRQHLRGPGQGDRGRQGQVFPGQFMAMDPMGGRCSCRAST